MKQIPNFFTLLNLVFGTIAIIFILQTSETIVYMDREGFTAVNLPEKIVWGSLFIFLAAVIDFLDGFVARLLGANSEMGKQLDSLADLVSFGVAPGLIVYQLLRISFAQEAGGLDTSIVWLLPALLIPCAAAWRLARYNLDNSQQFTFKGLPAPAAGLLIASFPLVIFYKTLDLQLWFINKWVLYIIIILVVYLLVSTIPLMSLKMKNFSVKNNLPIFILLIITIISAAFLQWLAVPVILLAYIALSLFFKPSTVI
ncbi:MAG: CDP-alcohol phosphatidyltransferase family protein [Chitinophagaceae bacterium]|jgi:CDP-diacylglycerol--serine O-phosphatidyltransferase|nr:CDP-alcohol phosphatidyltransferase family protein [Chitinophagaceae bacterium]